MIILSIPYKNKQSLLSRLPAFTDLIEYRIDFADDISEIETGLFSMQDIITLRDSSEGGKSEIDDTTKKNFFNQFISSAESYLDCEYLFLKRNPDFNVPPERLILSLHTKVSDTQNILEFLSTDIKAGYYKLAVSCNDLNELQEISNMIPADKVSKIIIVPMHPCPLVFRLLYKLYGSQAGYVYLHEETAPNQPSLTLASHCRIKNITPETDIYVIIGSKQIIESMSIVILNFCYARNKFNYVMLPVIAETANEALEIINQLKANTNLKGVAITMPFKKQIPAVVTGEVIIANSWIPATNQFTNTDEHALKTALDKLKIQTKNSVLIIGTGATSKSTQKVLKEKGFSNVHVMRREQINHGKEEKQNIVKDFLFEKKYDLLINCTPFGQEETDNPDLLPDFKALIDLPYGTKNTTLTDKAIKEQIPHINGTTFWKWQANEQGKFFGLQLNLDKMLV